MIDTSWSVRLGVPGGTWVAVALALLVLVVAARELVALASVAAASRRWLLRGLRMLTALGVIALAVQPQWVAERVQRVRGTVAVLVDTSRSMTIRAGSSTRAERTLALLERWSKESIRPLLLGFGREVGVIEEPLSSASFRDDDTRLRDAVETVMREHGDALGAIVVLSDGADRSPPWTADLLPARTRIHTVAVGGDAAPPDDAIAEVRADAVGFLRRPARVDVVVRSTRPPSEVPVVSLRRQGALVAEAQVEVGDDGVARASLPFTPSKLGREVYSVAIPVASDDAIPENNEREFLVRVARDKLRVLLVSGSPGWETRFLRAFFKSDPSIDLITFFILRTPTDLSLASSDELSLIPFPTQELFEEHLPSFDLVVFQDFDFAPYAMGPYLPRVRQYVLDGGGFAMLGGPRSFASGGYANTAISDILPVELRGGWSEGELRPRPVEAMRRHPLVELVPDGEMSTELWRGIAPLLGSSHLGAVDAKAQVLLEHPSEGTSNDAPAPVLVVGPAGQGRVLALAGDSTWRWGFTTAGKHGDASAYERFWDRAMRWLVADPSLEPSRIATDRERYPSSGVVIVRAALRDAAYHPIGETEVTVRIVASDGRTVREAPATTDVDGRLAAELSAPDEPGGHRVTVARAGQAQTIAEEALVVEAGGDELAQPAPRSDLLRGLADATGGTFVSDPDDAPALADLDSTRAQAAGTDVHAPFASLWFIAALAGLMCVEWGLRRLWGLR